MADMENQEDQKISECLQEAFGYSDEQLLKQLDHVNENFKDVSFAGAEDRLMKRFMERKAEMERKAAEAAPETTKSDARTGAISEITAEAEDCAPGEESKTEPLEPEKKQDEKQNKKKIVRFGKKKALATAALVAVIAGMLGGTAIGKKNYFFRHSIEISNTIVVDNDRNAEENSKLENAYADIESNIGSLVLKLKYYPQNMKYKNYQIYKDEAQINFMYGENIFTIYMMRNDESTSVNFESDRKNQKTVFNKWINEDVVYAENRLPEGKMEYEAMIIVDHIVYYIIGTMPKNEYEKILKNLTYF